MKDSIENEVIAREKNEWIAQTGQSFGVGSGPAKYLCECSAPNCGSTISLTPAEYEIARSHGRHFVICTDHENPELDYVVFQGKGFAIVEMVPGRASRIASQTDPRQGEAASKTAPR